MKGYKRMLAIVSALSFITGCVSMSTYEDMERDKNREITSLKEEKAELQQQKAEWDRQNAAAQQQIVSLEQEKAALAESSQQKQKQYEALTQNLSQEMEKGMVQVRQYKTMLSVELAEQVFFDSGSADVKAGGRKVLKKVGAAVKDYDNKMIRVVGYTDNVPVKKSGYKSNWDLSAARAVSVVRFLQEAGVPPERMIAAGRGEYDPVASNKTAQGRRKNRRIEIMLVERSLADELSRQGK
jgi:chemotaxis protein MotB